MIISLLLLVTSCTKEIPFSPTVEISRMVLNALLIPDSAFQVQLSSTKPITGTSDRIPIATAVIKLYINGTYIEDLSNSGNGIYRSSINPSENKNYVLEVSEKNYPVINTDEKIPSPVALTAATFRYIGNVYNPEYMYDRKSGEASISFIDPPKEKNYYEIVFNYSNDHQYFTPFELYFNDPVILNEGDVEYHPTSFFFSDQLFNGQEYTFTTKLPYYQKDTVKGFPVFVSFRSISYNYYKYRKTWTRHLQNQNSGLNHFNDIFRGEPIDMYSNVNNGFGIFAGFSQDFKQLKFIK